MWISAHQLLVLACCCALQVVLGEDLQLDTKMADSETKKLEFTIGLTWDGAKKVENPAKISLFTDGADLGILIRAPFYNNTAPPDGKEGEAYFKLWEYEVVEAFFLNDKDQYLELEFGPHGQHLMLLLDGRRNAIKHSLPMEYSAEILDDNTWEGRAKIPQQYFPPKVTKFNAYAIHGEADDRSYETLYEVSGDQPDFHRIEKFQPIDLEGVLPGNDREELSDTWKQAILENRH